MGEAVAIIPARLGSTRFPRKALAAETGRELVVHVAEAAARAKSVGRVVIATDGEEIRAAALRAGVEAVMTGEHANGTSRLNEAAQKLGLPDDAVIVNVQGDEPEIDPGIIDAAGGGAGRAQDGDGGEPDGAGERRVARSERGQGRAAARRDGDVLLTGADPA
jgi:3-deoxy-manno-octulosonate cytidylyltransferase (CMP-KDO synthetase)